MMLDRGSRKHAHCGTAATVAALYVTANSWRGQPAPCRCSVQASSQHAVIGSCTRGL